MLNSICDCSAQDRHTVMDCCRFRVHRGTDQRHAKSRGKPWQHTATKSSTTTMKGSSEARKERHRATPSLFSFFFFTLDGNTEPSKASFFFFTALQQTHKHREEYEVTVYSQVCVLENTHTFRHTKHTYSGMWECSARGGFTKIKNKKNRGSGILCSQSWRHTHEGVEVFIVGQPAPRGHTQRSPEAGLRTARAEDTHEVRRGRKGGRGSEVVWRQAPLRTHKGGQWWYLRGPCGRALPVSRSISCSCLRLIGPPVLLMHAATANPLWALASCRGLSTAEDVNTRAGDKKEKKDREDVTTEWAERGRVVEWGGEK